jgi:hypothetical protein
MGPKNEATRLLCELISAKLVKRLEERGFQRRPPQHDRRDKGTARLYPFGTLQRVAADGLQPVEIQMDWHGKPKFAINFGTAPATGVTYPWAHFKQEECEAYGLRSGHRLYSRKRSIRWFQPRWFDLDMVKAVARMVSEAASGLDEVMARFDTGAEGPYLKGYSITTMVKIS